MKYKKDPIWTQKKIEESVEKLYEMFSKAIDKDPQIGMSMVLHEFCILQVTVLQLQEAFIENHKVSSGAFKNSHEAAQLYAQVDAAVKTQGSSFSKRLEKLER
tara:strand:- start:273 stop:581 length:309 start_codon:yes stop_codon:yes gene_type:complete